MTRHYLKTHWQEFDAVWIHRKSFEFRINDRDFQQGDVLILQEYFPNNFSYGPRKIICDITYILAAPAYGIPPGYCILNLKETSRWFKTENTQWRCIQ